METVVQNSEGPVLPSKGKKRKWIYAKKPSGTLYNYRQIVGYGLLLFLFLVSFYQGKWKSIPDVQYCGA
ncbi:hypothetical protein [Sphingobacterium sp. T2]|uniref:hypothetical protein n=1 Tax=Sphingobacterium sp. T2 TaxID=1590596 RepID=UPI000AECD15D|nr:hypothetical protein [Sphingobacterium sp. T2]